MGISEIDIYSEIKNSIDNLISKNKISERDNFLISVESEIQQGKQKRVKLTVKNTDEVNDPVAGPRKTQKSESGEFIQREELNDKEKLTILVDDTQLSIAAPPLMAVNIVEVIASMSSDQKKEDIKIHFFNEETQEESLYFTMDDAENSKNETGKLRLLLSEVSDWLKE